MKIYDISQELFTSNVFPGDLAPSKRQVKSIENGDIVNLTELEMCAHNGTHVDAPSHFYAGAKNIDELDLSRVIGKCFVFEACGEVTGEMATRMMKTAKSSDPEAAKRILIKGKAFVSLDAAKVFSSEGVFLVGNESQTVGPESAPASVHYELLGAEVVLLEGVRLSSVPIGVYFLFAAPINLGGCEGSPCRAVLVEE